LTGALRGLKDYRFGKKEQQHLIRPQRLRRGRPDESHYVTQCSTKHVSVTYLQNYILQATSQVKRTFVISMYKPVNHIRLVWCTGLHLTKHITITIIKSTNQLVIRLCSHNDDELYKK